TMASMVNSVAYPTAPPIKEVTSMKSCFRRATFLLILLLTGCRMIRTSQQAVDLSSRQLEAAIAVKPDATPLDKVNAAAIEQTTYTKTYDASYIKLDYPNGDVPRETGVCADVIVRAFRSAGLDLQKELHEDMTRNFSKYPQKWAAKKPDPNID